MATARLPATRAEHTHRRRKNIENTVIRQPPEIAIAVGYNRVNYTGRWMRIEDWMAAFSELKEHSLRATPLDAFWVREGCHTAINFGGDCRARGTE
jgi:hypothetical protein